MATETGNDWCERLYHDKAAKLVLYGRALGLSHGEAEDVVQEVFLTLLQTPSPPENAEHYALRSFRNRALNFRRGLWRRVAREFESHRWFEKSPDESPLERAAMRCLAKLPREQREALVLKIWHGRTFAEIGALLEVSPNTVAARHRYALEKLRAGLKGENHEQSERTGETFAWLDAAASGGAA
jgi:RNA polymerase sigma-70 factor (ECF subfamily)